MSQKSTPRRSFRRKNPSKRYIRDAFGSSDDASSDTEQAKRRPHGDIAGSAKRRSFDQISDVNYSESGGEDTEDVDEDDDVLVQSGSEEKTAARKVHPRQVVNRAEHSEPNEGRPSNRTRGANGSSVRLDEANRWKAQSKGAGANRTRGLQVKASKSNHLKVLKETYGERQASIVALSMSRFMSNATFPVAVSKQGLELAFPPGFHQGIPNARDEHLEPYFDSLDKCIDDSSTPKCVKGTANQNAYLPQPAPPLNILMGPHENQQHVELCFRQPLSLDACFSLRENAEAIQLDGNEQSVSRKGWLINVGARVLATAWAPVPKGATQYLAVSVEHKQPQSLPRVSPFAPGPGFPASVQVWEFYHQTSDGANTVNSAWLKTPRLVQIICSRWGSCRRLRWCPAFASSPEGQANLQCKPIGRLGSIWNDGYIRVLDVSLSSNESERFVQYPTPFFEARAPNTVSTCLDWLGRSDLAVACANGYLAVWNLTDFEPIAKTGTVTGEPYFYQECAATYILDIASARPIAPYLVAIVSADGNQRLVDLRQPWTEQVLYVRSRIYAVSITFSPHAQGFYTTDDHGDAAFLPIRRFYSARRVMSTSEMATGSAIIAASPCHTSILVGTPSGLVAGTNPVRKQMDTKNASAWIQTWFLHEWRRNDSKESDRAQAELLGPSPRDAESLLRLSEGFRAEKFQPLDKSSGASMQTAVVYNEQQAVTSLEWNPNVDCGAWAAAGTGSGLLRVEDLAV